MRVPVLPLLFALMLMVGVPTGGGAQTVNEAPGSFTAPGATQVGYLLADLHSGEPERVRSALAQLGRLGDGAARQLIEAALRADIDRSQKTRALDDAARRGGRLAQDAFILALSGRDRQIKSHVLRRVRSFESKLAIPILLEALKDPKPANRIKALRTATSMDTKTQRHVLEAAAHDSDVTVRAQVAGAAASLPKEGAWPILQNLLSDANQGVRSRARASAHALGIKVPTQEGPK